MKIIKAKGEDFKKVMARLDSRQTRGLPDVAGVVEKIIRDVRVRGDKALFSYTSKFDGIKLDKKTIKVSRSEFRKSLKSADPAVVEALEICARRIRSFHERQKERSWSYRDDNGATLGQIINPLDSVGIYIPGGKASYPSSALMNAIPARIAGVRRIVMVTPAPYGVLNPYTLVAAEIAGVDEVYKVGGAQAVAALAFGSESVKPVDKITGPGNVYVAEAKRQVFGKVDIDMIAGPSEILILADKSANPKFAAADLLSQAEHDENAYPILVTTSASLAEKVAEELKLQTKTLDRRKIVRKCLGKNCFAIVAKNLDEAFGIANRVAPEHLELLIKDAKKQVGRVKHAGAVFVGPWTPEALGDYAAGPNHVLPTGCGARFFSPLGVYDFIKRTSLLEFTKSGCDTLADPVIRVAEREGLQAHARAVAIRVKR